MTIFIITKFNNSDDQTNIDKIYRVAANITDYQNKSSKINSEKAIISCKKCMKNVKS